MKVGLILPLTGPFAPTGRQIEGGAKLYMQQHGDKVAGKKIELIVRDDGNVADATKRIAQELVVNEKVERSRRLRPDAARARDRADLGRSESAADHHGRCDRDHSRPLALYRAHQHGDHQITVGIADWAPKSGLKKVVTLVSDFAPGIDIEKAFSERFKASGGEIIEQLRVPLANPDFAPFLQRAADAKPDGLFVFVPAGVGASS